MSIQRIAIRDLDSSTHRMRVAESINGLIDGKLDVVGTFTLTANAASSVIEDNLFESQQVPLIIPTTANAAAEIGAGTIYLSARTKGSFTLTHANNAQTDRTYLYVRLG
jgi:hypothetical protein